MEQAFGHLMNPLKMPTIVGLMLLKLSMTLSHMVGHCIATCSATPPTTLATSCAITFG
jgi:hypothetical protein